MGSEFLKKTRSTHVKSIDRGRVQLGTPDLFMQMPEDQPRCAVGVVRAGAKLRTGETLIVEPNGTVLIASRGNSVVARIKRPPADIMRAICDKSGVAKGKVLRINQISKTADISIC